MKGKLKKKKPKLEGGEALLWSFFEQHPVSTRVQPMIGVFVRLLEHQYGSFGRSEYLRPLSGFLRDSEFQMQIKNYLKYSGDDETRAEFKKVFSDLAGEVEKPEFAGVTYDDFYSFCLKVGWASQY